MLYDSWFQQKHLRCAVHHPHCLLTAAGRHAALCSSCFLRPSHVTLSYTGRVCRIWPSFACFELLNSVSTLKRWCESGVHCSVLSLRFHEFLKWLNNINQGFFWLCVLPHPKWKRYLIETVLFCIHSQDLPWGVHLCVRNRAPARALHLRVSRTCKAETQSQQSFWESSQDEHGFV